MKKIFIALALIVIIALLLIIAVRLPRQSIQTTPSPEQIVITPETPTPIASTPETGTPTPKAPDPTKPGVEQGLYPQEVDFWVDNIRVPSTTAYEGGYNYIPIQKDDLKTFSGRFGPYYQDPTEGLIVTLCAEINNFAAAPQCERVPLTYRERYVSFAKGYQYDEYIGGMAAKDFTAYFIVTKGDTILAQSNLAVIRTVND